MRSLALPILFTLLNGSIAAHAARPIEADINMDTALVILPLAERDEAREIAPVLAEIGLTGTAQTYFNNGARLRARISGRMQRDHPTRPGGIGGFGVGDAAQMGAFSGLSAAAPVSDAEIRARFEQAYVQYDGGYGELRIGKDQGIAARFFEGAPSTFSYARLDSSLLDPTGLSVIRTRHDVTGPSAKLSYATPRMLGLRAGLSYTPDVNADGLDRSLTGGMGLVPTKLDSAIEFALNLSRRLPARDIRFDAALAWSQADIEPSGFDGFEDRMQTLSSGGWLGLQDWYLGGSVLHSQNGKPNGDYASWRLGLGRNWRDYDWSLNYAEAEDESLLLTSQGWRFGVGHDLAKSARISLGYINDRVRRAGLAERTQGIVVEITLSEEFMKISGT